MLGNLVGEGPFLLPCCQAVNQLLDCCTVNCAFGFRFDIMADLTGRWRFPAVRKELNHFVLPVPVVDLSLLQRLVQRLFVIHER